MEDILTLKDVSKSYPKFKMEHISFSLPAGCIMGFIGENGAGKSTTIKLILNLIFKDSGEIRIFGQDHASLSSAQREQIGVVMDELHLPGEMTAANVSSVLRKIYRTWDADYFEQLLKKLKIDRKKSFREYSRGMKMKVQIAVALSHDTKLLILDEPTGGLDPVVREQILDTLQEFIQDESHSVFMSSHIMADLEKICDYIAFIHEGKLVLCEEKDLLMERYGVLKCTRDQLARLAPEVIVAKRENSFGTEALILRDRAPKELAVDAAGLDAIMVFYAEKDGN